MNKLVLLSACFAIAFISCKKSADKPCYGLVSPINAPQNISPAFTSFKWNNCGTMPSLFVLSAKNDFSKSIIKADTIANALVSDTILGPNTKYYWIVTVQGQTQSYYDSFTTGGVSSLIAGNYNGTGHVNNYGLVGDTTYTYSLKVNDAGNDQISLQLPGIDSVTFTKLATTKTSIVYTAKPSTGKYSGYKNITYYPGTGSLLIVFQTPGFYFNEWDFSGKKQVN